jgi:hypothetical protein
MKSEYCGALHLCIPEVAYQQALQGLLGEELRLLAAECPTAQAFKEHPSYSGYLATYRAEQGRLQTLQFGYDHTCKARPIHRRHR